jgi:hypothetical protein
VNQPPSCVCNAFSRGISTLGKQASVSEKMLPHGLEATILLTQRRDEVLKKEIGSGGEGYGVRNGGFEAIGVRFDGVEDLENGG